MKSTVTAIPALMLLLLFAGCQSPTGSSSDPLYVGTWYGYNDQGEWAELTLTKSTYTVDAYYNNDNSYYDEWGTIKVSGGTITFSDGGEQFAPITCYWYIDDDGRLVIYDGDDFFDGYYQKN